MLELVNKFERFVYAALMVLLMVVLLFALGELCNLIIVNLTNTPQQGLLENHELTTILGVFLLILIGVELLDTIKAYFRENAIHFEIVILLAVVAIARKVILLDPASAPEFVGMEMIGIGVVVVGLAAAYFLIKKAGGIVVSEPEENMPPS